MEDRVKHVVVVTDSAHINGGSTKVALSSALELARRGYGVTVFTATGPIDEELRRQPNLRVVCLEQFDILNDPNRPRAMIQGIWNRRAAAGMRDVLAGLDRKTTVVHMHSWTKALSASVVAEVNARAFPLVTTLHDYFTVCPTGTFFDHGRGRVCGYTALSGDCLRAQCDPRSGAQKAWRVARQAVTHAFAHIPARLRHVITISGFSEAVLRPYFDGGDTVFHRVGNPIDAVQTVPSAPGANTRFTYLGRLSKEKGVELFARATALAGVPAQAIGSGDCEAAMRAANHALHFPGWLDHAAIEREFRRTRVLVLPSLCYETFGLTVLEGAAAGIPALVPDGTAAADNVEDGRTGLIFKNGDIADLAAKLRLLNTDDALVERLGAAAYERFWQSPPTIAHHVDQLDRVYANIAQGADA